MECTFSEVHQSGFIHKMPVAELIMFAKFFNQFFGLVSFLPVLCFAAGGQHVGWFLLPTFENVV